MGSPTDFGEHAAILVGDFLFSAATDAADAQALLLDEAAAESFTRRFADMHAEVALGQYLDIVAEQTRSTRIATTRSAAPMLWMLHSTSRHTTRSCIPRRSARSARPPRPGR